VVLPLDRLTIVTGENGAGKSSFYRSLRLMADVAQGATIGSLAREGGLPSVLWAGPETISRSMKSGQHPIQGTVRSKPVGLKLGFASKDYGYAIDLGMPIPAQSLFDLDPVIKAEAVWIGEMLSKRNSIATRVGPAVMGKDDKGRNIPIISDLPPHESMMTHAADPKNLSELLILRERMRDWRFYDHFRTDRDAPARQAKPGTRTPVLSADGGDLAAAIQTIFEVGDDGLLDTTISDAFPGVSINVQVKDGIFHLVFQQYGLLRPLGVSELSDGTLRYLLLTAALLTPRPPSLMVLNEPETSLHPDLLAPLARQIVDASNRTQIIVVTHSSELGAQLSLADCCVSYELSKKFGETVVRELEDEHVGRWVWPKR